MIKIFFTSVFLLGLISIGQSQIISNSYNPTVFHPTPNVQNLNGFIDYPVNLSTGGVNISIPIYTIEQGDIQLPISIDYNVNNVKVNSTSSNIGLGWSLNAGGVVSRTTKGVADESPNIGFMFTPHKLHLIYNGSKTDVELGLLEELSRQNWLDLQADDFYYSGPYGSGRFAFDQISNNFVQIPLTNDKLEYSLTGSSIENWLITDDKGIKYFYGLTETSKEKMMRTYSSGNSIPSNTNNPVHFTSWHLSKIQDTKGNEITLEYDYVGTWRIKNITKGTDAISMTERSEGMFVVSEYREVYLKKINFKNGYIEFKLANTFRDDLENSKAISGISVFDIHDNLIKEYRFEHDYFITTGYNGIETDSYNIPASNFTRRLKLNSISELNPLNFSTIKKYDFDYQSLDLPAKFSTAQDYWGRFNCEKNSSLIPRTYIKGVPMGEAERGVNDQCILASTLRTITFPTGAKTEYTFEPNIASSFDVVHFFEQTAYNKEEDLELYFTNWYSNKCVRTIHPTFTCEFTMPELEGELLYLNLIENDFDVDCPEKDNTPPGSNEIGLCNYVHVGFYDENNIKVDEFNNLKFGKTYKSQYQYASKPPNTIENSFFFHNLKFKYKQLTNSGINSEFKVDGLRIKEIKTTDNGVLSSKKTYNYEKEDGLSSGYTYLPSLIIGNSYIPSIFSSDIAEGAAQPGTYYGEVQEVIHNVFETTKNINKKYVFFNKPNEIAYTYPYDITFPSGSPNIHLEGVHYQITDIGFLKSNIEKVSSFDDSKEILVEETNYDIARHNTIRYSFPAGMFCVSVPQSLQGYEKLDFYKCLFHYNYTSQFRVESKEITEKPGDNIITNKIKYSYSENNPLLISSKETTNSLGDSLKTEYQYPQDLTSNYQQSRLMQDLVSQNRVSTPIITKNRNNNTVTSEQRTLYKNFEGIILPEFIYAKNGEMTTNLNDADLEITYNEYDENGNLTLYTLKNGIPVRIIWAYSPDTGANGLIGGSYPIARIENPPIYNLEFKNYEYNLKNSSLSDYDEFEIINIFSLMRKSYPNSMITGYTYDPLIGVTSIIQPNGQIEYYEYDAAGRLETIKDQDGKLIKSMEYHYKN